LNPKPLFSLIIPTYNAALTLSRALESILQQTFTSYEILIMDGFSSDETVKIAFNFDDKRIRIISERDQGIYDAMNKGIGQAVGEWLYFLGGDDRLSDSSVLARVASHITRQNVDVLYGNVNSTRFNGVYDGEFWEQKLLKKNICHQAIFFNKCVFLQIGNFDTYFRVVADWDHNFRWFFSDSIKKSFVDIVIAEYSDGGLSSVEIDQNFRRLRLWREKFAKRNRFSLKKRMLLIGLEIFRAMRQRQIRDAFKILTDARLFLGA
jgi:glycosyltransferase involved in cell wall biosynthesis